VGTISPGDVSGVGSAVSQADGEARGEVPNKVRVAFVWDNFGPMHNDRCEAVAAHLGSPDVVLGVELSGASETYGWRQEPAIGFRKVTLFPGGARPSTAALAGAIVWACLREGVRDVFLCHYERGAVFWAAVILRVLGARVFTMMDSKFDDYERHIWRELGKRFAHAPYVGGIAAAGRSKDYMRFLGHAPSRIEEGYNGISVQRIRDMGAASGREPPAFADRDFLVVARLVPKKNIAVAIEAFRLFTEANGGQRKLRICGAGPLEADLKAQTEAAGLEDRVVFHGFEQIEVVSGRMAATLALLLPSVEEQFGLVVSEAQALGVPVILSPNCGARDELVRSGVNGFLVESDNPAGMAVFMSWLSRDEATWRRMSEAASTFADKADVVHFVRAVEKLTGRANG
jgi:glycosyltransferase involved in cell wall biosynthesis